VSGSQRRRRKPPPLPQPSGERVWATKPTFTAGYVDSARDAEVRAVITRPACMHCRKNSGPRDACLPSRQHGIAFARCSMNGAVASIVINCRCYRISLGIAHPRIAGEVPAGRNGSPQPPIT